MKTIKLENGKEVQISDESYKALEEGVQAERWRADYDKKYYYVTTDDDIYHNIDLCSRTDTWRYNQRNYFKTKNEAVDHRAYLKAIATVKDDAKDFVPDWSNFKLKHCVIYDHERNEYDVYVSQYEQEINIYFETEEDAQNSIDTHKTEWDIIFGIK